MTEQISENLFWILIFPGFVFTAIIGLIASWLVRKVSALVQWRVGPKLYQPFADVIKLLGKETLIPRDSQKALFFAAPLVALTAVLLLATMLWKIAIEETAFIGDIIVAIYLMVIPSLALILGSSASASPHAAFGTSREMKMVLAYELPLALAFVVIVIKNGGELNLAQIAQNKAVFSVSGLLAFLVGLLCVQAKLGFVPFDIAESETEVAGGVIIEYSGVLLALWKLTQAILLVALPLFLVLAFLGGFHVIWAGIAKFVLILVLLILIKNTNPRLRIDQAMKFFWVYCGIALIAAVVLAGLGNYYSIAWL